MTVHRTMAHVVLLLIVVVTSGCAEPKPRAQVVSNAVPRGKYATLRQVGPFGAIVRTADLQNIDETFQPWLELEVRYRGGIFSILTAYANQLVCMRRWQPWGYGGYVMFEPGTDLPKSYAGDFGVCITEPPISARHKDVDELTCNFSSGQTVRVHGFAWPAEVENQKEAIALSRKRAEAIEVRLASTALPNRLDGVEAHGTERTRISGAQGPDVIGAYFEIRPPVRDVSAAGLPVTPQFLLHVAKQPHETLRAELEALLASSGISGVPAASVGKYEDPGHDVVTDANGEYRSVFRPYIKLTYRPQEGGSNDDATVYSAAWKPREFREAAIVRWAEKIIDEECGASKAAPADRADREGEEK